jgi:hypothetical protein
VYVCCCISHILLADVWLHILAWCFCGISWRFLLLRRLLLLLLPLVVTPLWCLLISRYIFYVIVTFLVRYLVAPHAPVLVAFLLTHSPPPLLMLLVVVYPWHTAAVFVILRYKLFNLVMMLLLHFLRRLLLHLLSGTYSYCCH